MINFNDSNESDFYPQSEEERIICQAKLAAFNEMQCWIEHVTNQQFSHNGDFRRSLSDGCMLCNLLNCLKSGSIKRINRISTPMAGYDNIAKFLRVCEEDFGLRNVILFETSDLEDLSDRPTDMTVESDRRLQRVLICLFHLAKSVENQLTTVTLDSKPFKILLHSQDHKEIRRLKSNSMSADSSNFSKLITNQNPDYLATRAYETLNRTNANKEILHRSSNDEEWQESLENWKEKRRQVISNTALDDSKDDKNVDNQELLELKERARKMKLLRDQLKDQSTVSIPQTDDQIENGDSKVIPNIDEETMAMIERVKQKKLAEENKRKFNISPQLSPGFASDSEQSTSTAVDKPDDDTQSISEKHDFCEEPSRTPEMPQSNTSANNTINNYSKQVNNASDKEDIKTRLVNIKLISRSKQDSDRLWGMDVIDGVRGVLVSKVKIGSCADVCDIRKGDEIVAINSEDVSNKSVQYIRSLFNNCESVISGSDAVTLSLRRNVNEDEEAEFYSSDQSEDNDDKDKNIIVDSNPIVQSKELHEHEINYHINDLETIEIANCNNNLSFTADDDIVSEDNVDTSCLPHEFQSCQLLAESYISPKDESSCHMTSSLFSPKPEITNTADETDFGKEAALHLSVQDKITKIESQTVVNPLRLSSSWNVPKTSSNDPVFCKSTSNMVQSIDRLCWNSEHLKYRQFGSGNSSLSNLYHYWETEAPKSVSSSHTNKIAKSAPIIQSPIRSMLGDKEKSTEIDMEIAEQQFDTSNGNLEQTWRNVHSSGNSSTSDDISALNETIIMPQYKASDTNVRGVDKSDKNSVGNYTKTSTSTSLAGCQVSTSVTSQCPVSEPVLHDGLLPINNYPPRTNTSTGIQADLIQCRKPTNYTNITTAFKSRGNKSNSYPLSQLSDDETCSITLSNFHDHRLENGPSSPESKESYCMNIPSVDILNMNDLSKDYTTVTAVTQRNENPRKFGTYTSLSNESSITGVSDNNEKSVEIEVSITPQLFPIRHRTLIQKPIDDKYTNSRSNDISTISNCSYADDITLQSDYVKVTDLDDVISPIREESLTHLDADCNGINDRRKVPNTISDPKSNSGQPSVKIRKKHIKINSAELPIENGKHNSQNPVFSDNRSHSLLSTVDTDHSMSTVPVPTLFKGGPKSENTLSQGQMSSRSDSGKSKKLESILSSKKLKNRSPGDNNTLSESKRSSSTKELRFKEFADDKDWNFTNSYNSKRTLSFSDEAKNDSTNNTKYSTPQSSTNQFSDILPASSSTKSHTKSYSIERSSMKPVSSNHNTSKKVPKKSIVSNVNETKTTMKCNYCAAFVGLEEDLMVIEELNLHFHLKCFICSECKRPLGDGKSDTDVRIRRSKLHCMTCYHKKSSKSKHRVSSNLDRTSQSVGNISQNKGGNGDGLEMHVHAGNSNNCAIATNNNNNNSVFTSILPSHASGSTTHRFSAPIQLQISYLDTF